RRDIMDPDGGARPPLKPFGRGLQRGTACVPAFLNCGGSVPHSAPAAYLISKRPGPGNLRLSVARGVGSPPRPGPEIPPVFPRRHMTRAAYALIGYAVLATGGALAGQTSAPTAAEFEQRLNACTRMVRDWAGLTRYGSDNAEVPAPAAGETRVVFLG